MSARETPYCRSAPRWIAQRLGGRKVLAPLTGQDSRALRAFVHLVELYGNSDGHGQDCAVMAMACCVSAMQPSTRHLAKAAIPHVLDWGHEEEIWDRIERVAKNTVTAVERAAAAQEGGARNSKSG